MERERERGTLDLFFFLFPSNFIYFSRKLASKKANKKISSYTNLSPAGLISIQHSKRWKRLEPFPIFLASLFPVTKERAVSCTFRGNAFSLESNGGWAFRIPVLAHCTCQGQMTSFRRKDVRDGAPTISVVVIHPVDRPRFW